MQAFFIESIEVIVTDIILDGILGCYDNCAIMAIAKVLIVIAIIIIIDSDNLRAIYFRVRYIYILVFIQD